MELNIMKRRCNLDLCLLTPSLEYQYPIDVNHHNATPISPKEEQKLTIFYNGKVGSCDVTDIQARSIILLASQEAAAAAAGGADHEKLKNTTTSPTCSELYSSPIIKYKQDTGLSMKKSLQHFLQKRRNRIQATSPYTTH